MNANLRRRAIRAGNRLRHACGLPLVALAWVLTAAGALCLRARHEIVGQEER